MIQATRLDTRIPFTTAEYLYLNRGAADRITGKPLAYQSIFFPRWEGVWAYLAINEATQNLLFKKDLPAIPDFPTRLCLGEDRVAFYLEAWNAIKIGIPQEVVELRASLAPEPDPADKERKTISDLEQFLETGGALV